MKWSLFVAFLLLISVFAVLPVRPSGDVETDIILVNEDENDIPYLKSIGARMIERYESGHALVEIDRSLISEMMQKGLSVDTLEHRTTLYLGEHVFDFAREETDLQDELRTHGYEPGEKGLYIVQMMGPIALSWRPTLEDTGVEVLNYIPNYAYRVRMTPEVARDVEELYFVDRVGLYHPGYKIQSVSVPGMVEIELFPSYKTVREIGGMTNMMTNVETSYGTYRMLAHVDSRETLHAIAKMTDVLHISTYVEPTLSDEMATQIVAGGLWFFDDEDGDPTTAYRKHGDYGSYMNQIGYTGKGVVIAVADSGIGGGTVDNQHPDFQERVIGGYSYDPSGCWGDHFWHGSHVAGSAAGNTHNGTGQTYYNDYYSGQGVAPGAELYSMRIYGGSDGATYVGPSDVYEVVSIAKQEAGAHIHTNSWGYGEAGTYSSSSSDYDAAVRAENMIITAAAGNLMTNFPRDRTVDSPATGKNVIAVGATQNYNPPHNSNNPEYVVDWSARGWTQDNRIKPDVVAPGRQIISTGITSGYHRQHGTSMATPAVAGAAAVFVEWYEYNHGVRPSPALVRSLLINTANDMAGEEPIPNRAEGWGMVDISKLQRPIENPVPFRFYDQQTVFTESLQERSHVVMADREGEPLKFSLAWTDKEAPGNTGSGRTLVNDLDLEVVSPSGDTYRGNAFSGGWSQPNTGTMSDFDHSGDGWDDSNNIENVYIHPDHVEEGIYTVRIIARHIADDGVGLGYNSQDFALVVYNAMEQIPGDAPSVTLNSPDGGEVWEARTDEDISWTAVQGSDPIESISLELSVDGGTSWITIEDDIPNTGSYTWNVANVHSSECIIRVRAIDEMERVGEDTSDGHFEIVGVPVDPPSNLWVEHYGETGTIIVFEEDFQEQSIGQNPDGWTRKESYWTVEDREEAGGTAPELVLEPGDGTSWYDSWIRTPAIDTSGQTELDLSFRHSVHTGPSTYSTTFRVRTSTDQNTWAEAWSVVDDGDIPATQVNISLDPNHGVGSETLYIQWEWTGAWSRTLDTWNIDDVVLFREGTDVGDEHNLLTWDASPDDPDEVSHYNIYRSESSTGPWDEYSLIYHVDADGSPAYEYVDWDKGMSDETYWWYVVRAVGKNGMEEDNTDSTQEPGAETTAFHIPLPSGGDFNGWNFVSFNLVLGSSELADILDNPENGISGNYDRIMYFDSYSQTWLSHVPGRPEHFNNLRSWDNTMGVWIRMTAEDTLTIQGTEPSSTILELHPGWNMVGLPSESAGNHDLPGPVTTVAYFQGAEEYNVAYTSIVDTFIFEPGKGYWVYNSGSQTVTWTIDYRL